MHKYCNKRLPAGYKRVLNKNILRLNSKESRQTRSESNLFFLLCKVDLIKQSFKLKRPIIV